MILQELIREISERMFQMRGGTRRTRLSLGIVLCAVALFAFVGCPDDGGPGGTTPDTAPPVITLTGDAAIEVEVGSAFTEPGFAVNDNDPNYAGTVTPTIRDSGGTEVLTSALTDTAGAYIITYTAPADAAGNTPAAVMRTVTVQTADPIDEGDTAPPVITLTGDAAIEVEVGGTFTEPGFAVNDNDPNYAGTVIPTIRDSGGTSIDAIDTATAGTYIITYTADNDAAGNEADPVTRTVTVADTAPPVITLTGDAVIVEVGNAFTEPGFEVNDNDPNYAGIVTPTIRDSGGTSIDAINTATAGTYIITYTADNDAAGNSPVAVTRMVTVRAPNPIDIDGDRLIDIDTLEELNAMRHSLRGTSYRASAGGTGLLCGADAATACIGYELLGNLDFDSPASYASGTVNLDWRPTAGGTAIVAPDSATNAGWDPIGDCNTDVNIHDFVAICGDSDDLIFGTTFEGGGFTISNLYARNVEADGAAVGLFGTSFGTIQNIGVVDANIYGGAGGIDRVGGLVGNNNSSGTVTASYATGSVDGGTAGNSDRVGGLVGENNGTVTASYATGSVNGGVGDSGAIGGLVGLNTRTGTITASYATGDADGGVGEIDRVGGLVGLNASTGTITASYATGDANGGVGITDRVGGLVGENSGTVTASYATGAADGGVGELDRVGGLVGDNTGSGTIIASYATGNADGGEGRGDIVGGLVGENINIVTASYGFGTATGETHSNGVTRSDDATDSSSDTPPGTVDDACDITRDNSSTMTSMPDNRWDTAQWDFAATTTERPFVRFDGNIVPGQTERGC